MSVENSSIPIGSRPIPFAPGYRICDGGDIWSCRTRRGTEGDLWHPVKVSTRDKRGYLTVQLCFGGPRKRFLVHRIVLEVFVGPCPPGLECCHRDGNPRNNRVKNLHWGTRKKNAADRRKHGRDTIGEHHGCAVLRDEQIPEIFRLFKQGYSKAKIGRMFGVTDNAIRSIIKRKTWAHVPIDDLPDLTPKTYAFVSPSGERFEGISVLKHFCEHHGLSPKMMSRVHTAEVKSHLGWTKPCLPGDPAPPWLRTNPRPRC